MLGAPSSVLAPTCLPGSFRLHSQSWPTLGQVERIRSGRSARGRAAEPLSVASRARWRGNFILVDRAREADGRNDVTAAPDLRLK